jgi:hypothetical protein
MHRYELEMLIESGVTCDLSTLYTSTRDLGFRHPVGNFHHPIGQFYFDKISTLLKLPPALDKDRDQGGDWLTPASQELGVQGETETVRRIRFNREGILCWVDSNLGYATKNEVVALDQSWDYNTLSLYFTAWHSMVTSPGGNPDSLADYEVSDLSSISGSTTAKYLLKRQKGETREFSNQLARLFGDLPRDNYGPEDFARGVIQRVFILKKQRYIPGETIVWTQSDSQKEREREFQSKAKVPMRGNSHKARYYQQRSASQRARESERKKTQLLQRSASQRARDNEKKKMRRLERSDSQKAREKERKKETSLNRSASERARDNKKRKMWRLQRSDSQKAIEKERKRVREKGRKRVRKSEQQSLEESGGEEGSSD